MIKSITLRNIHSYRGTTTVHLGPDPELSSVLGRNGSGKSTFLKAIAFVAGSSEDGCSDFEDSYVEAILSDETVLRRSGSTSCCIDGTPCELSYYRDVARKVLQVRSLDMNEDWKHLMGDPQSLMEYIELLPPGPDFEEECFSATPGALREYKELLKEEADHAAHTAESKANLTRLKRNLHSVSSAQDVQVRLKHTREATQRLRAAKEIYKMSLCVVRLEILTTKQTELTDELDSIKAVDLKDADVLKQTSAELERMRSEQTNLNSLLDEARERFSMLIDEANQCELEAFRLNKGSALRNIETSATDSLLECLKDRIKWFPPQSEPLDLKTQLEIGINYLEHQSAGLRRHHTNLVSLRQNLDQLILRSVEEFEASQSRTKDLRDKLNDESANLRHLKTDAAHVITSIRVMQTECLFKFSPEDQDEDPHAYVESLKLTNPLILGGISNFIECVKNSKIGHKQEKRILQSIFCQMNKLVVIVENDELAILLARKISFHKTKELVFLARSRVESARKKNPQIPENIAGKYSSVLWLSDILKTNHRSEEHLIDFVAHKVLVVPNETIAEDIRRLWSEDIKIVDYSGNIHEGKTGIVECDTLEERPVSFMSEERTSPLEDLRRSAAALEERISTVEVETSRLELQCLLGEGEMLKMQMKLKYLEGTRSHLSSMLHETIQESSQVELLTVDIRRSLKQPRSPNAEELLDTPRVDLLQRMHALLSQVESKLHSIPDGRLNAESLDVNTPEIAFEQEELEKFILGERERLIALEHDIERHEVFLQENSKRSQQHNSRVDIIQNSLEDISSAMSHYENEGEEIYSSWQKMADKSDEATFKMLIQKTIEAFRKQSDWVLLGDMQKAIQRVDSELSEFEQIFSSKTDTTELDVQQSRLLEELVAAEEDVEENAARHFTTAKKLSKLRRDRHKSIKDRLLKFAPHLESVYKSLYPQVGSAFAQTYLSFVDEEDIDRGISFYAIPAGKPFRPISQLSGGELSMAVIAFQIAAAITFGARVLLIDEVDAHLDNSGVRAFAQCLTRLSRSPDFPCSIFLATHQRKVYNCASQFIGLYKRESRTELIIAK